MSASAEPFRPSRLDTSVSTWADENYSSYDHTPSPDTPAESDQGILLGSPSRSFVHRNATRSIRLDNLATGTTVSDIVSEVRGGQLLEVYLRYRERAAVLSFVHEHEALDFYHHFRRHDLYIKSKRIQVSVAARQQIIASNLAKSIRSGATRNLVIRQCDPNYTADSIRDDVEHIHNLIVCKVEFRESDCYVSTNSISGALFARTCMSSRL
jgi:hypothetical protein